MQPLFQVQIQFLTKQLRLTQQVAGQSFVLGFKSPSRLPYVMSELFEVDTI